MTVSSGAVHTHCGRKARAVRYYAHTGLSLEGGSAWIHEEIVCQPIGLSTFPMFAMHSMLMSNLGYSECATVGKKEGIRPVTNATHEMLRPAMCKVHYPTKRLYIPMSMRLTAVVSLVRKCDFLSRDSNGRYILIMSAQCAVLWTL